MKQTYFQKTLLVEDQGLTRQAMKTLLVQCDPELDIDEANDYDSCLRQLASGTYDLLFLDLQLGVGRSGLDILRWIAENEIAIHTVILSGQDDRETVLECIKQGASGFISKASDGDDNVFKTALDTILSGQIYLPNSALGKSSHRPAPGMAAKPVAIDTLALSPRLAETLGLLCQGLSNKVIARKMALSESTVKEYSSDLLAKFGVRRRTELIVEMARRGIVVPKS